MSRLAIARLSRIGLSSLLLAAAPAIAADVAAPKELPAEAKADKTELIGLAFGARLQSDNNFRGITQSNHDPSQGDSVLRVGIGVSAIHALGDGRWRPGMSGSDGARGADLWEVFSV